MRRPLRRLGRAFVVCATAARACAGGAGVVALSVIAFPFTLVSGAFQWHEMQDWVRYLWGAGVLWLFGIRVRAEGQDAFPEREGCLLLFNHQSLFDIPVLCVAIQRRFQFGAKAELFKIPIFGPGIRAMGTLPIARDDRAGTLKAYKESEALVAQGFSFALAPEGTRQERPAIGPFKAGPFIFAIGAQAPVVLAAIRGAHEVLPKGALLPNVGRWTRTVHVRVTAPISTKGMTNDDLGALIDRARASMIEAFEGLPAAPAG